MKRTTIHSVVLLLAAGLLLLPLAMSFAEDAGRDGDKAKPVKVSGVFGKLELTDAQRDQIAAVQADAVEKIKAIRQEEKQQIMALLTDEQKAQLERLHREEQQAREAKPRDRADKQDKADE
jgi:Spy/CpxP family protein refolding chaperone